MTSAVLSNVAWVPYSKPMLKIAEREFEKRMYNDKNCSRCEYLSERHCDVCDTCPAFLGHYRLWRRRTTAAGRKLIGLPTGNRRLLKSVLQSQKITLKDRRIRAPRNHALRFTATLTTKQEEAVAKLMRKGYGLLEAPPRSGKTVMGVAAICRIGHKALVLASQTEWLQGFYDTICGNKTTGVQPFTNVRKFGAENVVGFARKLEDFEKYDICLVTYQTFLSVKGQALLKKVRAMFGTVIIDEADKVAARLFLKVVNHFSSAYRFGLTGTPDRKDGREILTNLILGPSVHVMEVEMMLPRVVIHETRVKLARKYKQWTAFENALVEDADRNRMIIKQAVADIKAGRSLVIPVTRVHHAIALAKAINKVAGESVATHFIGSQSKDERRSIIEKARNGDIACIVGMRQLVQRGINVPRWDTLYVVMHISNPPNFKQESSRIRTPFKGKQSPLIRHYIEDEGPARGCLRTCYWQTYRPEGFLVDKPTMAVMNRYMGQGDARAGAKEVIKF